MKRDVHFWIANLVRGFFALLAGSAILVVPDMARTLLLLPFAITIAFLGLACYGIIDSTLVFVSSFMVDSKMAKAVLRVEGCIGTLVGVALLYLVYEKLQLVWFLTLIALQALAAGVADFILAKHTRNASLSRWDYVAGFITMLCGCGFLLFRFEYAAAMTDREVSWAIYAYLLLFGMGQCLTAARMLYADFHHARVMPVACVIAEA